LDQPLEQTANLQLTMESPHKSMTNSIYQTVEAVTKPLEETPIDKVQVSVHSCVEEERKTARATTERLLEPRIPVRQRTGVPADEHSVILSTARTVEP
jgi:hypothetical protein